MPENIRVIILIVGLILLSGLGDSQGFIRAANIWEGKKLVWAEFVKSVTGFGFGILMYFIALKYMKELGVISPEIQTIIWFGITIIGVAVVSNKFVQWQIIDQLVALGIVVGIGWLLVRTGG